MHTALRPLPRIPPGNLSLPPPTDVRSYRPLPTPPLLTAGGSNHTSSTESIVLPRTGPLNGAPPQQTTPESNSPLSSLSSVSLEMLPKPRPRLHISVVSQTLRKRNSLDSLTVRSPAFCDPGQTLSPAVDRGNNTSATGPSRSRCAPYAPNRSNRVSVANLDISPLVFKVPTVINGLDAPEPEEDEPTPVSPIPEYTRNSFEPAINTRPPRSRFTSMLLDRTGTHYPVLAAITAATNGVSDSDGDEIEDPNPDTTSSVDLTNGRESRACNEKNRKPFQKIARVVMKAHLFRSKARPPKSADAPITDTERVSQPPSPLNQTWYKERGGWRWVKRDVDEVLAELRRLR